MQVTGKIFSSEVLKNKKLINSLSIQNARKSYEYLQENENLNNYNVEIYNSRLELFLYMGRQLNPDITELKRAENGEKFSAVKEIGFYLRKGRIKEAFDVLWNLITCK